MRQRWLPECKREGGVILVKGVRRCCQKVFSDGNQQTAVVAQPVDDVSIFFPKSFENRTSLQCRQHLRCSTTVTRIHVFEPTSDCATPAVALLAVRVGFEPTEPVKVQRFSRPPDSTTLAPHHVFNLSSHLDLRRLSLCELLLLWGQCRRFLTAAPEKMHRSFLHHDRYARTASSLLCSQVRAIP